MPKLDWSGARLYLAVATIAIGLTAWQVRIDRSVFERYFGSMHPVGVVIAATVIGALTAAWLQANSAFTVVGPGLGKQPAAVIAWSVPLLAAVAIAADILLRFDEGMNVALPDALRFYPAIALFVEVALHMVPISVLVVLLGTPTALDGSFWRIALPVTCIEAALQAAFATSAATGVFSAVHLVVFGVIQVWMFWRFGFMWMFAFRLAYYLLWHVVWGMARLELLF